MVPSEYWKEKKIGHEKLNIENTACSSKNYKERCNLTKILSNTCQIINLGEKINEQTYLSADEKKLLKNLWKKYEDLFEGTAGDYDKRKISLNFKKEVEKRY